jgi:hypothetical protein
MTITFIELLDRLKQIDETSLLEILDISSEDLVERFSDLIEDRYDTLIQEFPEDETSQPDQYT